MSLEKNQLISLDITGVTGEGNGVGRAENGMTVFVPFTAVGDEIICRIQKVDKRFAYGKALEWRNFSKDRMGAEERFCPVYGKCGGCAWRHISYEAEGRYKWQKVADALSHIAKLDLRPQPLIMAPDPDRYRNKAQYSVAILDGQVVAGFYAPRSHRVIPHTDCALQPVVFAQIVSIVTMWMQQNGISVYEETYGTGLIRHIYLRQGEKTGEVMVVLVAASGKIPALSVLVTALRELPGFCALLVNINRRDTNVILGDKTFTVYGHGYIHDELCGLQFRLSPHSFYQVNRTQAECLYRLVAEEASLCGDEILLDLYCGTGTIGLTMAHRVKTLIGVDIVPAAIEDAKKNARQNGIQNAHFICADASAAAKQLQADDMQPDVVLLDPPRKGCTSELISTVAAMHPSRVVYISCNPATLARDLRLFAVSGYMTERVTPVDLFPGTAHVECVVLLSKVQK